MEYWISDLLKRKWLISTPYTTRTIRFYFSLSEIIYRLDAKNNYFYPPNIILIFMNIYFTFATNFSQTFVQISLLIISNFSFLNLYQSHSIFLIIKKFFSWVEIFVFKYSHTLNTHTWPYVKLVHFQMLPLYNHIPPIFLFQFPNLQFDSIKEPCFRGWKYHTWPYALETPLNVL